MMRYTAANAALLVIEQQCTVAEDREAGGDTYAALGALAAGMEALATIIAPYAYGMPPTPYPHVLLVLSNGSTLRTTQNTTADIAGLINAGAAKIYQVIDTDGVTHNVVVSSILDFYQVTAP